MSDMEALSAEELRKSLAEFVSVARQLPFTHKQLERLIKVCNRFYLENAQIGLFEEDQNASSQNES